MDYILHNLIENACCGFPNRFARCVLFGFVDNAKAIEVQVPDELITPHPRFHTLTRNIRSRKGRKAPSNLSVRA